MFHALQECVDALIRGAERITQGNSRGGAVVESNAHPVDRQVTAQVLGSGHDRTAQVRAALWQAGYSSHVGTPHLDEAAQHACALQTLAQTLPG